MACAWHWPTVPPGVSGGTIAFILGFYERFLNALHDLFGKSNAARKDAFLYLVKLGVGWVVGMGLSVLVPSSLFESYVYLLSSIFFGLTLVSIPFIIKQEKEKLKSHSRTGHLPPFHSTAKSRTGKHLKLLRKWWHERRNPCNEEGATATSHCEI